MRVTTEQCDEAIDTVRRIRDALPEVRSLDRQLGQLERPDGYRGNVRPMQGAPSSSDEDGHPLPPHSDSTGSTVVTILEGRSSSVRHQVDVIDGALREILSLARQAEGALARALEDEDRGRAIPAGCRNHAEHGMGWEPVLAKERCRWCYEFWAAEGVDAPEALLEARARGRRISEAMVDQALAHRRSKRARARRRRKAG